MIWFGFLRRRYIYDKNRTILTIESNTRTCFCFKDSQKHILLEYGTESWTRRPRLFMATRRLTHWWRAHLPFTFHHNLLELVYKDVLRRRYLKVRSIDNKVTRRAFEVLGDWIYTQFALSSSTSTKDEIVSYQKYNYWSTECIKYFVKKNWTRFFNSVKLKSQILFSICRHGVPTHYPSYYDSRIIMKALKSVQK